MKQNKTHMTWGVLQNSNIHNPFPNKSDSNGRVHNLFAELNLQRHALTFETYILHAVQQHWEVSLSVLQTI